MIDFGLVGFSLVCFAPISLIAAILLYRQRRFFPGFFLGAILFGLGCFLFWRMGSSPGCYKCGVPPIQYYEFDGDETKISSRYFVGQERIALSYASAGVADLLLLAIPAVWIFRRRRRMEDPKDPRASP
jgi:hypothetical protein